MRMQVILDSSFARPGSAPIWGGKKGEFRDWTKINLLVVVVVVITHTNNHKKDIYRRNSYNLIYI